MPVSTRKVIWGKGWNGFIQLSGNPLLRLIKCAIKIVRRYKKHAGQVRHMSGRLRVSLKKCFEKTVVINFVDEVQMEKLKKNKGLNLK